MAAPRARRFSSVTQLSFWPEAVVLAFLVLHGANTRAGATDVSGHIDTDTTWTVAGSPYIVTGNVFVYGTPTNVTLTVQAGVEVRFNSATWLLCEPVDASSSLVETS